MIQTIEYKSKTYLKIQEEGYASQYAIPYAKKLCKGTGYDIGCMKKEWAFPNAVPVDILFDDGWTATNLPKEKYGEVDFIFSSHCLEHIDNWVFVLDCWYENIKKGGVLFLYLPHYNQEYWRPYNNKKHKHIFTVKILKDYMTDKGYKNIFYSGVDLNNSFMIVGEK